MCWRWRRKRHNTMRAAVHYGYGDTNLVRIEEIPVPIPGPGECLIRVMAASINPADWKYLEGRWRPFTGKSFPRQIGADFSGVVVSPGKKVVSFESGDAVLGSVNPFKTGTLAEYVSVPEKSICKKPESIGFVEAAGIPIAAVTAYIGLVKKGRQLDGKHVLITGSGGGVGHVAVQLAKNLGARVTAVCSTAKIDHVRVLGADRIIDYTVDSVKNGDDRYDVIFDCASTFTYREAKRMLRPGGEYLMLEIHGKLWLFAASFLSQRFSIRKMRTFVASPHGARTAVVAGLFERGIVKMTISACFPLEKASEALGILKAGHTLGKIAIEISTGA